MLLVKNVKMSASLLRKREREREREGEKVFSSIVIKRKYSFHFPPQDIDYIEERWVSSKIRKKIPRKIRQMPIRNSIAIEYALRCGRFVEIEIFLATSREMKAKQKFVSFFINTITNASFLQFWSKIKYSSRNSINIYFSGVRNINCEWNRDFFQHLLRAFFNVLCVRKLQSWIIQEKLQNTQHSIFTRTKAPCLCREAMRHNLSLSLASIEFLLFLITTKSCCSRVVKRAIIKYKLNVLFVSNKIVRRQIVASVPIAL